MQTKKVHKTDVNLLKPVNREDYPVKEDDCFGKEWNPQCIECSLCADVELCGIIYQDKVKSKVKDYQDKSGPSLDLVSFKYVDWTSIYKLAVKYKEDNSPLMYDELLDYVMDKAMLKDKLTASFYIERELPKHDLVNINNEILPVKR